MGLLLPLSLLAQGWESEYAKIESSIRKVQFPDKSFVITKYGASPDATAAKNQAAINKAIAACSKAGGGKVILAALQPGPKIVFDITKVSRVFEIVPTVEDAKF